MCNGQEIYKDYTTLNKKSDEYYHSVYIESDFFYDFDFRSDETINQTASFGKAKSSLEYRCLVKELTEYLRAKRKPFLKEYADRLVESLEREAVFPEYASVGEEKFKKAKLVEVVKALYEVAPKLFTGQNLDQKKIFVGLLDMLLDANGGEGIFKIIDGVVDLDGGEREDLAELLEVGGLDGDADGI